MSNSEMRTALITCGALAKEVLDIIDHHGWNADVVSMSATYHMHPKRIAPTVESHLLELCDEYDRIIVVYGDCGSNGVLDEVLEHYGIERVAGPHCYEMYGGRAFYELIEEEPGTFFLTDFLVRTFQGTVIRGLGLDGFPQLTDRFFRNYKRVVYLAQTQNPNLREKAEQIADYLELPLKIQYTGYGLLEERLDALMEKSKSAIVR